MCYTSFFIRTPKNCEKIIQKIPKKRKRKRKKFVKIPSLLNTGDVVIHSVFEASIWTHVVVAALFIYNKLNFFKSLLIFKRNSAHKILAIPIKIAPKKAKGGTTSTKVTTKIFKKNIILRFGFCPA